MKEQMEDEWQPYLSTGSDGKTIKNPALAGSLRSKIRTTKKGNDDTPWRTWTGQVIRSEARGKATSVEIQEAYEKLSKAK
jgi:hypothetical protein